MADKLLQCPFCGGEARILTDMQDTTTPVFSVVCDECESITYFGDVLDKEGTVEAWNNRPSPWHTGTPTEEGWYVLHYPECKEQPYELAQWNGEHFVAVKPFHAIIVRIEASSVPYWQKIKED